MAANPVRQTLVILFVCILAVGGVGFYVFGRNSSARSATEATPSLAAIAPVEPTPKIESNEDWRKQFLAGDTAKNSYKTGSGAVSVKTDPLSATDKISQEFFSKYAELRQSGLNADEKTVGTVMSQVVADNIASLPQPKTFTEKNLTIVPTVNQNLTTYGNTLLHIMQAHLPRDSAAQIANQALQEEKTDELSAIDPIIVGYRAIVSQLLTTPVPQALVAYHLSLVNGASMALYNANAFRHIDTDPVTGLAAASYEMIAMDKMAQAVASLQKYFDGAGVKIGS